MAIDAPQRFTRTHPCPICDGYDGAARGRGVRCFGFLSGDGEWAHCTREDHAGAIERHPNSETFPHRLTGECKCGRIHGVAAPKPSPKNVAPVLDVWSFTTTYDYRDESGRLVFQVCRYSEPEKTFRQRRPLVPEPEARNRAHWKWDLAGAPRVLYHLPDLLAAEKRRAVFFCEGEKDADRLIGLGLLATTMPGGAKKWRPEYKEALAGRNVILLEDNDKAGQESVQMVSKALEDAARSVVTVPFRDLPDGGDVSDWLDSGGTKEELLTRVRAAQTPIRRDRSAVFSLPDLMREDMPPARWAIDGLLPEGLTLLGGKAKMGKSWLMLGTGIAIASGGRALGQIPVQQGTVLFLALEDNRRRLQERCRQILNCNAAPTDFYMALEWPRVDEGGIDRMEDWIRNYPTTRLIVVDTLKRVRPITRGDRSIYDIDYEALQGMQELAGRRRISIVVVHHLRKLTADDPVDALSGTTGLSAASDGIWIFQRTRGEHDASIYVVHREGEDQELALTWDESLGLWSLAGTAEEYRLTKERREIMDIIIESGEAMTPKSVADALAKNHYTTKNLIRKMATSGELRVAGNGHYTVDPDYVVQAIPENGKNRSLRSLEADSPQQQAKNTDYGDSKQRSLSVVSPDHGDYGRLRQTTAETTAEMRDFPQQQAINTHSDYGDYGGSIYTPGQVDELDHKSESPRLPYRDPPDDEELL